MRHSRKRVVLCMQLFWVSKILPNFLKMYLNSKHKYTSCKWSPVGRNNIWEQKVHVLHLCLYQPPVLFWHLLLLMQCLDHSPHLQSLELLNPLTAIIGPSLLDWMEGGGPSDILPWGADGDVGFPWGPDPRLSLACYHCFVNLMNGSIGSNREKAY